MKTLKIPREREWKKFIERRNHFASSDTKDQIVSGGI
jgi:hypothetical protein